MKDSITLRVMTRSHDQEKICRSISSDPWEGPSPDGCFRVSISVASLIEFFQKVEPFGRFSLNPPNPMIEGEESPWLGPSVPDCWTLFFEDEYD